MNKTLNRLSLYGFDASKKVISIKENPAGKEIFFENRDIGIKTVTDLVSKGYKIG